MWPDVIKNINDQYSTAHEWYVICIFYFSKKGDIAEENAMTGATRYDGTAPHSPMSPQKFLFYFPVAQKLS